MNVRNCRKCGRVFNYVVGPILCQQCMEEQEKIFQNVKKYVQDHPGADMVIVSQECEVEVSQIRQWIREERLQFAEDSPIRIACEKCGTMIRSGRFCDQCKAVMTNDFRSAMGHNSKAITQASRPKIIRDGERMRYL